MQAGCLTSSQLGSVHCIRRGGLLGSFFRLSIQLSSGKSGLYMLAFQYDVVECVWYFFKSYFYCFFLGFVT